MNLLRSAFIGHWHGNARRLAASAATSTGMSFLFAKLVAVGGGPPAIGLLGGFMGLVGALSAIASAGIPAAIPAAVGPHASRVRLGLAVRTVALLGLMNTVAVSVALALLWRTPSASVDPTPWVYISLAAVTLFSLLQLSIPALYAVVSGPKAAAVTLQTGAVCMYGAAIGVSLLWPNGGAIYSLLIGSIVGTVALLFRTFMTVRLLPPAIDSDSFLLRPLRLIRTGFGFWMATLGKNAAWALIPVVAFASLGPYESGLLKASMSITAGIATIGDAWVAYSVYPALAGSQGDEARFHSDLLIFRRSVFTRMSYMALVAAVAAPILLLALYTGEFLSASTTLCVLLLASITRVVATTNTAALSAQSQLRRLAYCEWTYGVGLLAATALGVALESALALTGGMLCASLIYLMVSDQLVPRRRSVHSHASNRQGLALVAALAGVTGLWALIFGA